ncbi:hypothetical protein S83_066398 [Arachis hypogaea]
MLHLRTVFEILRQQQLFVNIKKCCFAPAKGVAVDPKKTQDMQDWSVSNNLKSPGGFLGLTGYYGRFAKGYGKIACSLTQLLKKDNFRWGIEAQEAFKTYKDAMTSLPFLAVPSFESLLYVGVEN